VMALLRPQTSCSTYPGFMNKLKRVFDVEVSPMLVGCRPRVGVCDTEGVAVSLPDVVPAEANWTRMGRSLIVVR
jgi:hypothetical protein